MSAVRFVFWVVFSIHTGQTLGVSCAHKTFGDQCQYECHCHHPADCTKGVCTNCESSIFSGKTCQKENIAFGKSAVQSSNYTEAGKVYSAPRAVDGKTSGLFYYEGCSHTRVEQDPWLYIDLEKDFRIRYLKIFNRHENYLPGEKAKRIMGFMVYVSRELTSIWNQGNLCYKDNTTGDGQKEYNVECTKPITGRYVGIKLKKDTITSLVLCELEVYSCGTGWYTENCDRECTKRHCRNSLSVCDITAGKCGTQRCLDGWTKFDCTCPENCTKCDAFTQSCKECPTNWYGTICNQSCDARMCWYNRECPLDGRCYRDVCKLGWKGKDCTCPSKCKSGYCDKYTASCSKCEDGFYGPHCDLECDERHCVTSDRFCEHSGACDQSGCVSGWTGLDCSCPENCKPEHCHQKEQKCSECDTGWYDNKCSKNCANRHCDNDISPCPMDGSCDSGGCKSGYYGVDCIEACPSNCRTCDRQSGNCITCKDQYYGPNSQCTRLCSDRNCAQSQDSCSLNGNCIGDCLEGWYGSDCATKCRDNNCKVCEKVSGKCRICENGFWRYNCRTRCYGDCKTCTLTNGRCLTCPSGKYDLTTRCGKKCENRKCKYRADTCQHITGACTGGCKPGYYGTDCLYACSTNCAECEQKSGICRACKQSRYGLIGSPECSKLCANRHCKHITDGCGNDGYCKNGCQDGWYDIDCTRQCRLQHCVKCQQTNGTCVECVNGKYGPKCENDCNMRKCNESSLCDKNGICAGNCQNGWFKTDCTERCPVEKCALCDRANGICTKCIRGMYGPDCTDKCTDRHCKIKSDPCPIDGDCQSGCEDGYSGAGCKFSCQTLRMHAQCVECTASECTKCDGAYYPAGRLCVKCNRNCAACTGYYKCTVCDPGYHGRSCNFPCSKYCRDAKNTTPLCLKENGHCSLGCKNGYHGLRCEDPCPHNCFNETCNQKDGQCSSGCNTGFYGETCDQRCINCKNNVCDQQSGICSIACIEGKYGTYCNETCSEKCALDNTTGCGRNEGYCLDCIDGRYGFLCEKFCNKTCALNEIGQNKCHQENGACIFGCIEGFHGDACEKNCSKTCKKSVCDQKTAACSFGCSDSWGGPTCAEEESGNVAIIAGLVLGLLVIIVVIVGGGVIFYIRKRKNSEKKGVDNNAAEMTEHNKGIVEKERKTEKERIASVEPNNGEAQQVHTEESGATYCNQESLETPETSVAVEKLWQYTQKMKNNGELKNQYQELPSGMVLKFDDAMLPENRAKNRYKNIYAYDHSRVKLNQQSGEAGTDYINACYIDGYKKLRQYIASQGPTEFILNDFWRMIWDAKSCKVVMLTNLIENKKQKCEMYWPSKVSGTTTFGKITVTLVKEDVYADFTIRVLQVEKEGVSKKRKVSQFHFTSWPDQDVPRHAGPLLNFRNEVNRRASENSPTIVHCSAGIGRTGTFIAIDYLTEQGTAEGQVDILECAKRLREQRVNMVQVASQYVFIHEAVTESLNVGKYTVSASDFPGAYRKLLQNNPMTGRSFLAEEYDALEILSPHGDAGDFATAKSLENQDKNRYKNILAGDSVRPYLSTPVKGTTDYINAIFISGYKEKRAFIMTQTPLPHTVIDLYRLISEQHVTTLIMMDDIESLNESVGVYWPDVGKSMECGPFTLKSLKFQDCSHYTEHTLEIQEDYDAHVLKLFSCRFWPANEKVPKSATPLLAMIDTVQTWNKSTGNDAAVIHCLNGAERSGLYCVLSVALEELQTDWEISLASTITQMRSRREHIVRSLVSSSMLLCCNVTLLGRTCELCGTFPIVCHVTASRQQCQEPYSVEYYTLTLKYNRDHPRMREKIEQFQFCHEAILTYLETFQTYSNFP